ncbi:MAG: cytochrome b/b6 domain-containing protein [Chloroflexi bacterium]|nr:cytochrome b/b6 domain-containing protein [Chloroflexota bacterium]
MTKTISASPTNVFTRFALLQRIEHLFFLVSFSLLGFTGLPQKYADSPISLQIFNIFGGVESLRNVHHISAVVMLIISLIHVLELLYGLIVKRTPISMIPWINDIQHVINDVLYYLGFRKHKAYYGRYSYAEKAEYLAVIWGTVVMALTGFMMWNPITTLRMLPGEAIPAAKAAHGGEAVLAVLAIIIWHFYNVHLKTFNKSMFTGKLNREEMHHEHPAELAAIESGKHTAAIPTDVLRKRQLIFAPFAIVTVIAFGVGIYYLVGSENTALTTTPQGETAQIFVPLPTPTKLPPTPTEPPAAAPVNITWDAYIGPIFQQKCAACHGAAAMAGLNISTYAGAIQGSAKGPVIVSKDSANSLLIQKQTAGGHPGQLTPDEITQVKAWIDAGAPEK